jgi:HTH-type transcriptional regulator/antitoxin HigA
MIKNEKEYRATRKALASYEDSLAKFDVIKLIETGIDPLIANAQRASYERQTHDLRQQIESYEALRSGARGAIEADGIGELGTALVEARVASGLTQRELANLAGLQEQQIQKYEKELYESASLRRLSHIAHAIGAKAYLKIEVGQGKQGPENGLPSDLSASDFPFADMNARGWFETRLDLRRATKDERSRALAEFFHSAPKEVSVALHRKTTGEISPARRAALLAWQARVLSKARQQSGLARQFSPPPAEVVSQIAKLSVEPDGIIKAVELLLQFGIIAVFEKHLPRTKLDGAAMSLDGRYGVIGMTIRLNRIDNFWFVLLHELGHLIRHWHRVQSGAFVDEEAGDSDEAVEQEANEFAENAILSRTVWQASLIRFTKSSDAVREYAARLGIHPALIAGRIRRERSYTEFSELLGSGDVKSTLLAAGLLE